MKRKQKACAREKEGHRHAPRRNMPGFFVYLPCISLGSGKSRLSLKLPYLFPGFSQACACTTTRYPISFLDSPGIVPSRNLILFPDSPGLSPGWCPPPGMVAMLAPTVHALSKRNSPLQLPTPDWFVCSLIFG